MSVSDERRQQRAKEFVLYASGAAVLLVAIALLLFALKPDGSSDDRGATSDPTAPPTTGEEPVTTTSERPEVFPEDRVAFITSNGSVLSGLGAAEPTVVATGAALDTSGQGSMALSPTGDVIAYVRTDGALVSVPVGGGDPTVLATDVWMDAVGSPSMITWDPTAGRVAYLAVGTEDMVEPRSETSRLPSMVGAHVRPLPDAGLGAVIKIVDRKGQVLNRIGDPSTRWVTGITYSSADDLLLVESAVPGEDQPYSLATANSIGPDIVGGPLSADEPAFSPDGNFLVAVGPRPGGTRELLRISTSYLSKAVLTSDDEICFPSVSPDGTRIAYGAGEGCSRLMLISSRGGQPVDVTPGDQHGRSFATAPARWTQDGHFLTFPDCRSTDDGISCSGNVVFVDPDRAVMIAGPAATTVDTVSRPLIADMVVHVGMSGPITYQGSFVVDADTEADLDDVSKSSSLVDIALGDDDRRLVIRAEVDADREFMSGTMTLVDPDKGINRTFVITGSASLLGLRVASVSGIWISTADMPFVTGEFRISILRGT